MRVTQSRKLFINGLNHRSENLEKELSSIKQNELFDYVAELVNTIFDHYKTRINNIGKEFYKVENFFNKLKVLVRSENEIKNFLVGKKLLKYDVIVERKNTEYLDECFNHFNECLDIGFTELMIRLSDLSGNDKLFEKIKSKKKYIDEKLIPTETKEKIPDEKYLRTQLVNEILLTKKVNESHSISKILNDFNKYIKINCSSKIPKGTQFLDGEGILKKFSRHVKKTVPGPIFWDFQEKVYWTELESYKYYAKKKTPGRNPQNS